MRRSPNEHSLLSRLNSPADLRRIPREQLPQLAAELRQLLGERTNIDAVDLNASLSAVELAVALHHVYRTPHDRLIWDGGQQPLAHRILTRRGPRLQAVRPRRPPAGAARTDSKYEHFAAGHSSTSISAALGMAIAAQTRGESRRVVAVLGDQALHAGMAFEALNHAGSLPTDLLVILNDERPAFAGGAAARFARAFSGPWYGQLRESGKRVLQQAPTIRERARRSERHLKGMVLPGTLFEEMGFNYTGPVERTDVKQLVRTLQQLQRLRGPQFLHVVSYQNRRVRRGAARSRPRLASRQPAAHAGGDAAEHLAGAFGSWLSAAAERDARLVCVAAAGAALPGLAQFAARFPERYFAVGGSEQHAVTFAAGLAAAGQRPVVALSSSLLQRAYDQLIHDVALQRLPVLFALDGAGLAGADSAAHQGSFDVSFLRPIPNLSIAVPADQHELLQLLPACAAAEGPSVVRLPRGAASSAQPALPPVAAPFGRGEVRREGHSGLALLVFGTLLEPARRVAERLDATLANMRFVKPLDAGLLLSLCARHAALVTIEESAVSGGAGSAVGELLQQQQRQLPLLQLGLPDRFIAQGTREGCLAAAGLDLPGMTTSIERWWRALQQQRLAAGA